MIEKYEWHSFQQDVHKISQELSNIEWSLIIGVARGGLPLAVALSHSLRCKDFGVVMAGKTKSEAAFDLGQTMKLIGEPALPDLKKCENVLIVDDIVALGDGFTMVENLVLKKYGAHLNIQFASLFADVEKISQGEYSDILSRIYSPHHINNQLIWIEFPWEEGSETIA